MRICKRCGAEVNDEDIRYCSRCGADLFDKNNLSEKTISDVIDEENGGPTPEPIKIKCKKRWIAALLQIFFGFTGISFVYTGFYMRAAIWLILNVIVALTAIAWGPMAFYVIFFVNIAMGLGWFFKKDLVDAKGNDLL